MANWVRTKIVFNGEKNRIDEIRNLVKSVNKGEDGTNLLPNEFDFNKIIPMPEDLNIESSSSGESAMRYLLLKAKSSFSLNDDDLSFIEKMEKMKEEQPEVFNEDIELGKKYLCNISKYGYRDWYLWSYANWGTKWNSSESDWVCDNVVMFDTAWSFAYPVIKKLSELFPDVEICFTYADEDSGCNTGNGKFLNGVEGEDSEYPENSSKRGYEIFLELHPEYEDELVYDSETDTYKWIETEDYID